MNAKINSSQASFYMAASYNTIQKEKKKIVPVLLQEGYMDTIDYGNNPTSTHRHLH